jgi:anti-anti-sigma factor
LLSQPLSGLAPALRDLPGCGVKPLGGGFFVLHLRPLASAEDQSVIVTFPDEIDLANADRVGDRLAAACRPGVMRVVADLTRTCFCDARGARMLARAHCTALGNGTELRFVIPDPWVQEVLQVAGVARLLDIYPSLNQSLL